MGKCVQRENKKEFVQGFLLSRTPLPPVKSYYVFFPMHGLCQTIRSCSLAHNSLPSKDGHGILFDTFPHDH